MAVDPYTLSGTATTVKDFYTQFSHVEFRVNGYWAWVRVTVQRASNWPIADAVRLEGQGDATGNVMRTLTTGAPYGSGGSNQVPGTQRCSSAVNINGIRKFRMTGASEGNKDYLSW